MTMNTKSLFYKLILAGLLAIMLLSIDVGLASAKTLGRCVFPTISDAPISQPFNNYNPALYGDGGYHKGVDLKIRVGTPIYADMDGVVITRSVLRYSYGRHLVILHPDGAVSFFGHLSVSKVSLGATVEAGQLIGLSGGDPGDDINGDGLSTGPHLHWEIRPAGYADNVNYAVDPYIYCRSLPELYYGVARVTAPEALNVRISPDPHSPVLYVLSYGDNVRVLEVVDGWARLDADRPEWVFAKWLELTRDIESAEHKNTGVPYEDLFSAPD